GGVAGKAGAHAAQKLQTALLLAAPQEPLGQRNLKARLRGRERDQLLVLAQSLVVAAQAIEQRDEARARLQRARLLGDGAPEGGLGLVERAQLLVQARQRIPFEEPLLGPLLLVLGSQPAQIVAPPI